MLHILWILIKFILIILGILLGLALLAVILLLFCPVRYQAKAVKETESFGEAELEARVTWLFRAVGARFSFHNGERKLVITLFGISLDSIKGWFGKRKAGRKKGKGTHSGGKKKQNVKASVSKRHDQDVVGEGASNQVSDRHNVSEKPELVQLETIPADLPEEDLPKAEKDLPEEGLPKVEKGSPEEDLPKTEKDSIKKDLPKAEQDIPKSATDSPKAEIDLPNTEKVTHNQEEKTRPVSKPGLFTRIREILSKIIRLPGNLWNKIISSIKAIIGKIKNIKKKVSGITKKLNWWKEFLANERTKAALALVWRDAKGLIRHVLPTKVEGQITFGCEDPAITGTALAVLGMTFPFHKNKIQVVPLFDGENQLTGNVSLKGRIYGIMFIKAAIEIYFNKNIKYVINRWKHKED